LQARKAALDTERTQLEQEFLDIIQRGKTTRMRKAIKRVDDDLKAYADRLAVYLEKRDAFEKDWYKCHPWLKESPQLESLAARKASLDSERTELVESFTELVEETRPQVTRKRKIRYYKKDLRAIEEQFLLYRENREAFEADWSIFCTLEPGWR
jgi:hypothetical protein